MKTFHTVRRVRHTADNMFDLVADVERYPEFVPLCRGISLRERRERDGKAVIVADMTVAYKLISETFTSQVTLDRDNRMILVEYLDGPFEHLENRWTFRPAGENRCEVDFYLAYRFRSSMLERLMGAMFDKAFRKFAEAFEARANAVYGRSRLTA